jgi:hypothetical protein
MSVLILHEANLRAAKSALRARLPGRGSGHLSEALAAALGFASQRHLVATLNAEADLPPNVVLLDSVAFNARLSALGEEEAGISILSDIARSTAIPDRPFVEFRDGDRATNDAHYATCIRLGRPMMMVKPARTYAKLDWEIITLSIKDIERLYGNVEGRPFSRRMFEHFQSLARSAPGKPYFTGSPSTGWVTKLLPDTARQLAEDYFRWLYLPMREAARAA